MEELLFDTHKLTADKAVEKIARMRRGQKRDFEALHAHERQHPKKARKSILNALEEKIGSFDVDEPAVGLAREPVVVTDSQTAPVVTDYQVVYAPPDGEEAEAILGETVVVRFPGGDDHEGIVVRDVMPEERPVIVRMRDGHDTEIMARLDLTGKTPFSWRLPD